MRKNMIREILYTALILCAASACSTPLADGLPYGLDDRNDLEARIALDFNKNREEVKSYIQKYIPDVTDGQMAAWEKFGALEARENGGQKVYFHAAARNLFRIDPECRKIKETKEGPLTDGYWGPASADIPAIISSAAGDSLHRAEPRNIHVRYTLTVKPDVVPAGEIIRCWLPFPRTDNDRQTNVRLINVSEDRYVRSPSDYAHSTLYMEKKAEAGRPTVFSEEFEYTICGSWFGLKPEDIKPYDKSSELYRKYTADRESHIIVTPHIRHLADSITGDIDSPLLQARALFEYVDSNYPWASAREYSTIVNIPEYVIANHHGDCGQVTLLFLTLCRAVGIPGHFESGFMMHPGNVNLHDWGSIYFEGVGWVPVDQSFGIPPFAGGNDLDTRFFYCGGIDGWRMIVNSDYSMPLYPAKQWPRSETVDFQRGEVEWQGGNLYFDKWSWNIEVVQ